MAHRKLTLSLALASTILAAPALAQAAGNPSTAATTKADADLPDGFEILNRYIHAIGGEEAYRKHTSQRLKGSFSIPVMGIEGSVLIQQQAPTQSLLNIELNGIGSVVQGTDGEVAWIGQPGQKTKMAEGELADLLIHEANFYAIVEPHKVYTSAKTVGTEMLDGVECYRVELETSWGQHRVALFEVESGLHRKMSMYDANNPEMPSNVIVYDDYREVGGIKRPYKLTITSEGTDQEIIFDSIEFDVQFPKDTFDPPGTM